jgi:IS605 OrfB family transposase
LRQKLPLTHGQTCRTACARVLIRTGVDEKTGEVLSASVVAERLGWCVNLVSGMAVELTTAHWNAVDVGVLAAGVDAGGRKLPANAWMALRRLGWSVAPVSGVRVNDRIVCMAQEQAGRTLRSAAWRAALTAGVLKTWPAAPSKRTPGEWEAVRNFVPDGRHLPSSVIKSRTRQVAAFEAYRDWTWVACPIMLPPTVPPNAVLHLPTLRITGGTVHAGLAYTHPVPKTRRTAHTVALGVDWGLNTLLSAGAVRAHDDGSIPTLGHGARFRAAGVLAKQHRLRRHSERLNAKIDHYERLNNPALSGKAAVLTEEIRRVSARRSNLGDALARAAARWAVDQAIAAGATVIYLEDLRSMEAKGMGRTMNTRLSQTVRGQITDRMRHLAAETGIAVVTVPPSNTSKHCPHCLTPLRHRKAPDRPTTPGWKWALCPNRGCGWQGDRDQGAWRRIAARGLTHQAKTITDQATGTMTIHTVVAESETKAFITAEPTSRADRSKTGPTRPRSPRPAPRRRRAPSPPGSRARWASVRRDTHRRTGHRCPAQPIGTRT